MSIIKALRRFTKFRIDEISLVDEGDNPGAEVAIFKRREPTADVAVLKARFEEAANVAGELFDLAGGAGGTEGVEQASAILKGMDMDIEQLGERLGEIEASLETVTKRATDAEAQVVALTAERDALIEKAKAAPAADVVVDDEAAVLKSLPESIRKRLEAAEKIANDAAAVIEKSRDDAELLVAVAKAKELGVADADAVGGLLHRIAKGKATAEDATKVEEILKGAAAVAKGESKLFEAIGKANGGDPASAETQLADGIVAIQKAKPGTTYEAAYAEVITAQPALYEELTKRKPTAA